MAGTNGMTYHDDWAIRVDGVSKRYALGEREQYGALRDVIARLARRVVAAAPERPDTKHRWALRDVSFRVAPGEVVGLVGRNGAGKSTLLKLISRITRPTQGETAVRGRVGTLLEVGSGFHPELTGAENIYLNGAILGMRHAEIKTNFDEIVEFSGIGGYLDTPVKRYSTGMYMRLAFAVAAHLDTEVLLVDEVLAVGDAEFQRKCVGRMRELSQNRGRTVLFVSHNDAAIRQLCPRTIWLDAGEVRRRRERRGRHDPTILSRQTTQPLTRESPRALRERELAPPLRFDEARTERALEDEIDQLRAVDARIAPLEARVVGPSDEPLALARQRGELLGGQRSGQPSSLDPAARAARDPRVERGPRHR